MFIFWSRQQNMLFNCSVFHFLKKTFSSFILSTDVQNDAIFNQIKSTFLTFKKIQGSALAWNKSFGAEFVFQAEFTLAIDVAQKTTMNRILFCKGALFQGKGGTQRDFVLEHF